MASMTILVWDYILTFSDEAHLLWRTRWSLTKCLFFLNRYLAFVDPILIILVTIVFRRPGQNFCERSLHAGAWMSLVSFSCAYMILMLRTWAIWDRNRIVTAIILVEANAFLAVDIFLINKYLQGSEYLPIFSTSGCTLIFHDHSLKLFIAFIQIVVSETTFVVLLAIKARQHYRLNQATWLTRVYEDGFIQYLLILANTIVNLSLLVAAGPAIQGSSIVFQQVVHNVLCNRVIFRVRGAYQQPDNTAVDSKNNDGGILTTEVPPNMLSQLSTQWSTRPPSEHSYDTDMGDNTPSDVSYPGDKSCSGEGTNIGTDGTMSHSQDISQSSTAA
ncbi:hypothetical protein BD410DRAFT_792093 [Rickenella mellea]|uniref:DUF6533 domain-containing protein n=1 Tax=Rickenella mellea TaxID=50990 RepID=A0A4Y7PWN9_9AGAM|nr:hypothetical protein BD410DRAFT_792093 [Rickenella mellea]